MYVCVCVCVWGGVMEVCTRMPACVLLIFVAALKY